jgi:sortase (surface protein transpeptidase)
MRRFRALIAKLARGLRMVLRPLLGAGREVASLVPALLAGAGVFLVVAGLFFYFEGTAGAAAGPSPSANASVDRFSLPPVSPGPSSSVKAAQATRVVIPALGVDLPVIKGPANEEFPLCLTAEFMGDMGYPGTNGPTYLYAHARTGMFLPLLDQSLVKNGAAMIGMLVEVYTDDNQNHVYEITRVIRGVPDDTHFLDEALADTHDQLWLQTSEGRFATSTKLQVVAEPVGTLGASATASHPKQTGVVCPKAPKCLVPGGSGCTP